MSAQVLQLIEQAKLFNVEDQLAVISELSRQLLMNSNRSSVKLRDAQQQVVGYLCSPHYTPVEWEENAEWFKEMKQRSVAAKPGGRPYEDVIGKYRTQPVATS